MKTKRAKKAQKLFYSIHRLDKVIVSLFINIFFCFIHIHFYCYLGEDGLWDGRKSIEISASSISVICGFHFGNFCGVCEMMREICCFMLGVFRGNRDFNMQLQSINFWYLKFTICGFEISNLWLQCNLKISILSRVWSLQFGKFLKHATSSTRA